MEKPAEARTDAIRTNSGRESMTDGPSEGTGPARKADTVWSWQYRTRHGRGAQARSEPSREISHNLRLQPALPHIAALAIVGRGRALVISRCHMSDREIRIARTPALSSLELSTGARFAGLLA